MEYGEKIQKLFLGRPLTDIQVLVFTPISPAFHKLFPLLQCKTSVSDGFFLNAEFVMDGGKGVLICGPTGASSQDVMCLFHDVDYYFFGLAGGLNDSLAIGDIVTVDTVFTESGNAVTVRPIGGFPRMKLAFSPCFLGPAAAAFQEKARVAGADVVDMESAFCAEAAGGCAGRFSELLVITDLPGKTEAWDCTGRDLAAIDLGMDHALHTLAGILKHGA